MRGLYFVVEQWATATEQRGEALIDDFETEAFKVNGTGGHERISDVAASSEIGLAPWAEVEVPSNVITAVLWTEKVRQQGRKKDINVNRWGITRGKRVAK